MKTVWFQHYFSVYCFHAEPTLQKNRSGRQRSISASSASFQHDFSIISACSKNVNELAAYTEIMLPSSMLSAYAELVLLGSIGSAYAEGTLHGSIGSAYAGGTLHGSIGSAYAEGMLHGSIGSVYAEITLK